MEKHRISFNKNSAELIEAITNSNNFGVKKFDSLLE